MHRFLQFLLLLLGTWSALAQTTNTTRYIISVRGVNASTGPIPLQDFINSLPHPPVGPGEWVLSNAALRTNLALLNLNPTEFQELTNQRKEYIIEADQRMGPNDGPPPDPLPTGWALQSLLASHPYGLPISPGCSPCQVTLYVVDTGVQKVISGNLHGQFDASSPVVWGAGLMTTSLIGTGASPHIDLHNHGTGVASTAVGKDTGLFAHLHGGSVKLEPCHIYFPSVSPPTPPWMSDAINVIFQASEQQLTRRSDASPMNDGGVLLFANRTNLAYSEIMERQMAEASRTGLVIVSSAGNAASNSDPELPATSAPMPNGCMPSVLVSSITPAPPIRTPSGLPLGKTLADLFTPCLTYTTPTTEYLLMIGATTSFNTVWASSNYGPATHLFAPGDAVTRANNASNVLSLGSGTSFSAGYAAGLALYYLSFRPWATLNEVRTYVISKSDLTLPLPPGCKTTFLRQMNLTNLTPPSCCLDYSTWIGLKRLTGDDTMKLADPDKDGLPNLLEWALNNNPSGPETNRGLSITQHGGNHYLQLSKAAYDLCNTTLTVEASFDLEDWSAPVPAFTSIGSGDPCANNRLSEALIPEPGDKKFYRLRVNAP
jgi:hypothetical protein